MIGEKLALSCQPVLHYGAALSTAGGSGWHPTGGGMRNNSHIFTVLSISYGGGQVVPVWGSEHQNRQQNIPEIIPSSDYRRKKTGSGAGLDGGLMVLFP